MKEVILPCFGDLEWSLQSMPPQWREAHPEAMRVQAQRRIAKVEAGKRRGAPEMKEVKSLPK